MKRRDGRRSGFTLIEVLTALTLTGLVALLAHRLMSVIIDSARTIANERMDQDRRENALRWLRSAFLSLEVGDGGEGFAGYENHVGFGTWLEAPEGWRLRERVTLQLENGRLTVKGLRAGTLVLADSLTTLAFDYLLEPGADSRWVRVWLSPLSAPLAVRMRWGRLLGGSGRVDTLLLLVKERG